MEHLKIETDTEGIRRIRLARPKVNAQNAALLSELIAAFGAAEEAPEVRGVLLCAEGRCFSAGLDLREVAQVASSGRLAQFMEEFEGAYRRIFLFAKPLACAVAGHGIAGGAVLPLMADHLVFADNAEAKFGLTELAVGVPFPQVAFEAVRLALPPRALRDLLFTARVMPLPEAYALGVGDGLVDDPEAACLQWLQTVASRPLNTFRIVKREVRAEAWARSVEGAPNTVARAEIIGALTSAEVAQALMAALT